MHFPDLTDGGRDYYAIAAVDPQTFTATIFPEMDSLIKKLGRTARYFEQQRQTIVSERADVDREVGALLHRQVVTDTTGAVGAALLEDQIVSLSRMFGMLATDSLLVRRSSEGISRYIKQLNRELKAITVPGSSDEIGAHYINHFSLDLAETHAESHNLDFSRQNAQAAIEVVRTQVEIMRAGEEAAIQQQSQEILSRSLVLQKERLALQVAAGFVEFVPGVLLCAEVLGGRGRAGNRGTHPTFMAAGRNWRLLDGGGPGDPFPGPGAATSISGRTGVYGFRCHCWFYRWRLW